MFNFNYSHFSIAHGGVDISVSRCPIKVINFEKFLVTVAIIECGVSLIIFMATFSMFSHITCGIWRVINLLVTNIKLWNREDKTLLHCLLLVVPCWCIIAHTTWTGYGLLDTLINIYSSHVIIQMQWHSFFVFLCFIYLGPTRSLRKRGQQQTSASQKTRQKKKPITYQKQKNTSKRKSDVDQASRGSQTDSEDCESQLLPKKLQQSDSGMFISPFGNRPLPKLPKMNASDTSTPSSVVHGKSLDDSCFGFDHIMSPQGLPFSPVESMSPLDDGHRPGSSMSGMSSLQGSISSGTSSMLSPPKRKYNTVNLSGLIPGEAGQSEMPAAKKTKKKKIHVPVSL